MKTQKINRKDLFTLYGKVCNGWQEKIAQLLVEQQINDSIEVNEELINKAYSEADNSQKKLLEKYFKINSKDIFEEIDGWNDILRLSGKSESDIIPWKYPKTKEKKSQNALAKIQLIAEVYNQGVVLDWNNADQYKYYPWWKKENGGWVFGSWDYRDYAACIPAGCYFKDSKSVEDVVKKFKDIYLDYLPE